MDNTKPCCPNDLPPVVSNYKGVGKKVTLNVNGEIELYHVGSGAKAIVFVYDIFGFHPNAFQVADHLAHAGYSVYIPDVFRGKPSPTSPFPPAGGWPELMAWIHAQTWDDKVKPVLDATIAFAKQHGATHIGGVGFCWGARQVWNLAAEGKVSVAAGAHPSFVDLPEVKKAEVPQCMLAAKDDPEWKEVEHYLKHESKLHEKNIFKRFDAHHGWLGARGPMATAGDYSVKGTATAASEAIHDLITFFNKNL